MEKCPNRVNASVTVNEKSGDVEEPAYFWARIVSEIDGGLTCRVSAQ